MTRMRLVNPTPNTPDSTGVGPAVSSDDRHVTFTSDPDGHFVHYVADVFTSDVQWSPTTR